MKSVNVLVCCALAVTAPAETLYPVYTVVSESTGITTNYLEQCTVQVVDSAGAEPHSVAYADIDKRAGSFSGTFVIEADSYLMGSVTMTNFTGEIRINRGALIVDAVGWLGVADSANAPKLYVESGASLVTTCPVVRGGKLYNEMHLAGSGYDGKGALCCSYRASHADSGIYNNIYLEDDATIGMGTISRVDMYSNYSFHLQNHTLTFKDVRATRNSSLPAFSPYAARFFPGTGNVEADHVNILVQGSSNSGWAGDKSNTLTMCNGATLSFYGLKLSIPWTLIVNEGETLKFSDNSNNQASYYRSFPATNANYYSGPVRLDGKLAITRDSPYTFTRGLSFYGDISGKGSIDSPNGWLQLMGSNTYEGSTCVRNGDAAYGGLALWREEAASTCSAGYFLTNAPLRLVADSRSIGGEKMYDLPPVCYHVDSFTNFEVGVNVVESNILDTAVIGGMNARMASLKKTGGGELALLMNFAITGRTEIAGGTLRLAPASRYSAVPGLWEGVFETNAAATAELESVAVANNPIYATDYKGTAALSNRVTSSAYLFARKGTPYWHHVMAPTYVGYIWNRTSENITVTFAVAIVDAWSLYLRGALQTSLYDSGDMGTKVVELHPGPNAIMLRGWNRKTSGGWTMSFSKKPGWNLPYMGFAMAYGDIGTDYNASSYFVPTNGMAACAGGDGILFTRDARAPEEFTAEELSTTRTTIADLAMSGGAVLDLSGSPLFVKTLEGCGTVTNGSLTIKNGWSLSYADVSTGHGLAVDGALALGEGSTVTFDVDGVRLPHGLEPVAMPLATAKDGVTGTPTFSCGSKNWKMGLSRDRKSLVAVFYPNGFVISFK